MGRLADALRECDALLQIAIDTLSLSEALRIARSLPDRREVVVEAGTPLVKSWGMAAVRALRSIKPGSVIVADTKTVDAAGLEAEAVSRAGGDVFTVLSSSSEETVRAALEASRSLGLDVYGDTVAQLDVFDAVLKASKAGFTAILIHVGVDVQKKLGLTASSMAGVIRTLASSISTPLGVAGGIKPSEVGRMFEAGARIVVVGSAVTRASDPKSAVLEALESLARAGARCR